MALLLALQVLTCVAAAGWGLALAVLHRHPASRAGEIVRVVAAFITLFAAIGVFHTQPMWVRAPAGASLAASVIALLLLDIVKTLHALRRIEPPAEGARG